MLQKKRKLQPQSCYVIGFAMWHAKYTATPVTRVSYKQWREVEKDLHLETKNIFAKIIVKGYKYADSWKIIDEQ